MIDIESLIRPNIAALAPYSTARDECSGAPDVFLDANESPYDNGFNRYPDPHQKALKQRLAALKGLPPECIFVGNGSDEAIDLVFRVFCVPGQDNAVAISPSYGMYEVAAATNDIALRKVRLRADFSLDSEALLAACDAHTKLLFLCSPNNPSGNAFSNAQVLDLAARFPGIVVVDEAYIDFCSVPSLRSRVREVPNLVVLQTLSKAWGMAGLRLGLAFAGARIISLMSRIKYPYNINILAQRAALQQLEEPVGPRVEEIVAQRAVVSRMLARYPFIGKIYPSEANFLLVQVLSPAGLAGDEIPGQAGDDAGCAGDDALPVMAGDEIPGQAGDDAGCAGDDALPVMAGDEIPGQAGDDAGCAGDDAGCAGDDALPVMAGPDRPSAADALYAHLLQDGIIVRNRSRVPGCEGCLRITIGTAEENRRLEASLERFQP